MPDFKPTASQALAIETRGRSLLVSAAAGSGKTKVLTERLLKRVCDPEKPADIDSFLIITFTKAAAAELRGRISDEIAERLSREPDNRALRRQSLLCRRAQIGTIHSFCASVLRENCHAAGLSPDFRVIEDDRAESIRTRVIERLMESRYEKIETDPGFRLLADTVGRGRDDSRLTALVLSLHRKMQSHARPDKWAEEQTEKYRLDGISDAGATVWGAEILSSMRDEAAYWAQTMRELELSAQSDAKIYAAYGQSLAASADSLTELVKALGDGWDAACAKLPVAFPRFNGLRKTDDPELAEYIKAVREDCKAAAKRFASSLSSTSDKLLSELRMTAPAMEALLKLTLDFDRAYAAEKRRRAELDFSDLEHMAARLLTDDDGSPTEVAAQLADRFTEIMVDEYQDVNRVQETIFRAVSKNGENLFMVGDVKQSIYRFRLADPTIFTEKYNDYADIAEARPGEPARIMLQENFRSRREVIEAANHVFGLCMSKKLGDIAYDEDARLKCGADYPGSVPVPELVLVDIPKSGEEDTPDKTAIEAAYAAQRIRSLVDGGTQITDHGQTRPLRWGDIAILMRSANTVGEIYRRELVRAGIPVASGQGGSFFDSAEISFLRCLLAIIDNPHQDVPLIAVLRFAAFGFTADELSAIRAADKDADFFDALKKAAAKSEKCAAFLDTLERLRFLAQDQEPGELLWSIYDELDLEAICAAMSDGVTRRDDLRLMLEYAKRFGAAGNRGLRSFCEWLGRLAERGEEPSRGSAGNAVQIMTVHKSKGLEFPVVLLCDTGRRFNRKDSREAVLIHPELGLGPRVTDTSRGIEYPTLANRAIKQRSEREMLSEEMRLLYVALTRAKERLIITAGVRTAAEKLDKLLLSAGRRLPPESLAAVMSPADWLMYAAAADKQGRLSMTADEPEETAYREQESSLPQTEADPELVAQIETALDFRYAHEGAQSIPSKLTATELKHYEEPDAEAQSLVAAPKRSFRRPQLGTDEKPVTGTERGIATHTVLQFIDYSRAGSEDGIRSEISRLEAAGFIDRRQAQAVDIAAIRRLFASPLGRRILSAESVRREFRFSLLCPAEEFFNAGEGESVLLQGVVDCCLIEDGQLVIVDYKTDRVRGEALYERAKSYEPQLRAYSVALSRIFSMPVKDRVLYFLAAGEAVSFGKK